MNDTMHNTNKERERERERVESQWIKRKQRYVPRFEPPSSTSPPSPRRISNPLTCPPRTPTEGTSTEEDLYNNREYQTPLSTNTMPPRQYKHNPPLPKRDRPVAKQPQITSTEEGYKHQPTPPHQEGANHNLNLYQRGSKPPLQSTSTKEGYKQ